MGIHVQCHANVSKQATLLGGFDIGPPKWLICGCGLNRFVHEGMNDISNVKVHLKTHSENVNIYQMFISFFVYCMKKAYSYFKTWPHF